MSGFTGVTNDDFFSFFAKYSATMIPTGSGYSGPVGGGDVTDVHISDVVCTPVGENVIRLQTGDGSTMARVSFSGIVSGADNTLVRLGSTSYTAIAPTANQFKAISVSDFVHVGDGLVIESPSVASPCATAP